MSVEQFRHSLAQGLVHMLAAELSLPPADLSAVKRECEPAHR